MDKQDKKKKSYITMFEKRISYLSLNLRLWIMAIWVIDHNGRIMDCMY